MYDGNSVSDVNLSCDVISPRGSSNLFKMVLSIVLESNVMNVSVPKHRNSLIVQVKQTLKVKLRNLKKRE